jgi:ribonuclease HII
MAWFIGIDEAGYGPNLGPFVMTSVAWQAPDELLGANLWQVLRDVVRRQSDEADERVVVDDSKAVHGSSGGFTALETNVAAALLPWLLDGGCSLAEYVERICPSSHPALNDEQWYNGATSLPTFPPDGVVERSQRFHKGRDSAGIRHGPVRSVAICAPRFNALLDEWGSKGAVLAVALKELLRGACAELNGDEAIHVFVDKHGGRNTYVAMLQDALPDGMVVVRQEGALRSHYEVIGGARPIFITFQPRADVEHFGVALASMASKYLREVFMLEFNRFWLEHVPGLTPTAGYPGDATRFLKDIRPAIKKLGFDEATIWRRK